MELAPLLKIEKGVTAIIGSGGKTTLLRTLSGELPGRVLLCTSTHFQGYADLPTVLDPTEADLRKALAAHPIVCAAGRSPTGKLVDCGLPYETLADLADFVLVEADGSRRRPLKAHARHEPVIPPCTRQVICVVGLSGLHRPVSEVVHRPELFCPLVGCTPEDEATPEQVARALVQEHLADTYFLNQAESGSALQDAKTIASHLKPQGFSVVAGSQREKSYCVL